MSRSIKFSGYTWRVKESHTPVGPGGNRFSARPEVVHVDEPDRLHLAVDSVCGRWYCSEVVLRKPLGYGTYLFHLKGRVDRLEPQTVLGLFLWSDDPAFHHREIDIEFSRWGREENRWNMQYVIQPAAREGNKERWMTSLSGTHSSHLFRITPREVSFASYHGIVEPQELQSQELQSRELRRREIRSWRYTGPDLPPPGDAQVRINYYLYQGEAPQTPPEEVVILGFHHLPSERSAWNGQ